MKNIKNLFLGLFVVSLASCLKADDMNIDVKYKTNVIEIANTGNNLTNTGVPGFYSDLGVVAAGGTKTFNINVNYTGPGSAPEDITVTLSSDAATLSAYNIENGVSKVVPPSSVFTFPTSVVIKKGTNLSTVEAKITVSSDFNFSAAYGLPIKISQVSTGVISGNFGKAVYSFGVRNKYDGVYKLKGYHTRVPYNYPYSNITMEMRTLGANSVGFYWPTAGGFGHPIGIGPSSVSWYGGAVSPVVVFDVATNLVTDVYNQSNAVPISIYTGPGSGQGRQAADKTMYIYWRYSANNARGFLDTLTYVGPR